MQINLLHPHVTVQTKPSIQNLWQRQQYRLYPLDTVPISKKSFCDRLTKSTITLSICQQCHYKRSALFSDIVFLQCSLALHIQTWRQICFNKVKKKSTWKFTSRSGIPINLLKFCFRFTYFKNLFFFQFHYSQAASKRWLLRLYFCFYFPVSTDVTISVKCVV